MVTVRVALDDDQIKLLDLWRLDDGGCALGDAYSRSRAIAHMVDVFLDMSHGHNFEIEPKVLAAIRGRIKEGTGIDSFHWKT